MRPSLSCATWPGRFLSQQILPHFHGSSDRLDQIVARSCRSSRPERRKHVQAPRQVTAQLGAEWTPGRPDRPEDARRRNLIPIRAGQPSYSRGVSPKESRSVRRPSWFSRAVTIVLALVLMPVLFHHLAKEELGVWLMLAQTSALLLILDLGLSSVLTPPHRARKRARAAAIPQ